MNHKGKILVTGGCGYIGSITTATLIEQGFEVIIVDNLSNSEIGNLQRIKKITGVLPLFYQFDLQSKRKVLSLFKRHPDIVGVIHFAAAKAVGESVKIPLHYYRNNIIPMLNLLEGMQRYKIENFIFSSSCTVYGQPDTLPVSERAMVKPAESPYGYTKQVNENILKDFIQSGMKVKGVALRYFNPIGAHASGLLGELPIGIPNNLLPFITQTAIGKRKILQVFGDDYNTPDGSCIRDYIHVVDLANAHILALMRLLCNKNKSSYEIFNIGTGTGFSVFEVIHSFEKISNSELNYEVVKRRPGDIEQIWADAKLANEELKWKANLSLDEMTSSAWKWELNYSNKSLAK